MKELPTGLQVFEYIRQKDTLYVDKTDMVYNLVSGAKKQYFVSRPRRFGKTLLCWTLNALFSGKRELFEGLAISKTNWEWESFPVIHLDMSKVDTSFGIDKLVESLVYQMKSIAEEFEADLSGLTMPGNMLTEIIVRASKKYGKPAVVIVDEYDKPFTDFFTKPQLAEEARDILRNCYGRLKASEQHIRFLFMTGICKFTKAGVFSVLNNLNDISLNPKYGALFGYTEKELVECFDEHLKATAGKLGISVGELVDKLRAYYDGFCFDGIQRVYNPFSMLNFFDSNGEFDNYWMESGSPKIIADYMKGRNLTVEQFRGMPVTRDFARTPGEIETASPESFLYQTGYLTLREAGEDSFLLDYPNTEVLNSMSRLVAQNFVQDSGDNFLSLRAFLVNALADRDGESFIEAINSLLASIPYDDYIGAIKQARQINKKKLTVQEWLYRSTILAFLRGCDVLAFGEMHSSQGRSDLVVAYRGVTWVIEIKVTGDSDCRAKAEEAMAQISDSRYAEPYKNAKKLAIAIDDSTRQVGEWIEAG